MTFLPGANWAPTSACTGAVRLLPPCRVGWPLTYTVIRPSADGIDGGTSNAGLRRQIENMPDRGGLIRCGAGIDPG